MIKIQKKPIVLLLSIIILASVMFCGTEFTSAQETFVPITPDAGKLGITEIAAGEVPSLNSIVNSAFKIGIAIAGSLAVIMIIFGGIQYMTTDAISGKQEGRERINHAIMGLLLTLSAWLILNTINSSLVDINFKVEKAQISAEELQVPGIVLTRLSGSTDYYNALPDDAQNKVSREQYEEMTPRARAELFDKYGGFPTDSTIGAINPSDIDDADKIRIDSKGTQIRNDLAVKLRVMNAQLKEKNIEWAVTEAWPPSAKHKHPCHNVGAQQANCIDANFRGNAQSNPTADDVRNFMTAAKNAGLKAEYEVKTAARERELVATGIDPDDIKVIPWATAPHFSVYNQ